MMMIAITIAKYHNPIATHRAAASPLFAAKVAAKRESFQNTLHLRTTSQDGGNEKNIPIFIARSGSAAR
jgi:hypothetical protein